MFQFIAVILLTDVQVVSSLNEGASNTTLVSDN